MDLKWGIFAPCINEIELIEAKLEWALERFDDIVMVEGHHKRYTNVNESGLSLDGTTEILKSYSDRIKYRPVGAINDVMDEAVLRGVGYNALDKDLDVVIMCDVDEFYLDKDLEYIEAFYKRNKYLKSTVTNSYIFLDNEHCAPHIQRKQGPPFAFSKQHNQLHMGMFHERIFRYSKWYSYNVSPFLVNDLYGRFIFSNEIYYDDRVILEDVFMLHYKNFKREEATKRMEMYNTYGDGIKHDDEWDILEKNKILYDGEHPLQITKLL